MSKRRWDARFRGAAILLLGGVLGGVFALIPFYAANPGPTHDAQVYYIGLLAIALVLSVICAGAGMAIKSERDDSVAAIKEDMDDLLEPYEKTMEPSE